MSDGKHTPGPWTTFTKLSGSENHKGFFIVSPDDWRLADVFPVDEDGIEGAANAEFIVRACNAHEELVEALRSIENDDGSIPAAIWNLRNAALAKAEGKA